MHGENGGVTELTEKKLNNSARALALSLYIS